MAQHVARREAGPPPHAPPLPDAQRLRTAWMPAGILLLEVTLPPARADPPTGPADVLVGGVRLMPPVASLALPGATLLVARAGAACAAGASLQLRREGRLLCEARLGPPGDPLALLQDRAPADQARLLPRLLAAAPAFRARTDPGFAALCLGLAARLAAGRPPARALAGGGEERFSAWVLPAPATPSSESWHLLAPGAAPRCVPPPEPGTRLLLLDGLPGPGAILVSPGGAPIPLAMPRAGLPGLAALARRGGATRQALLDQLAARARADEAAAALLRETQLLVPARAAALDDPALPVGGALELALLDGAGGVFLRGWLRDPLGLVRSLALRGPGCSIPLPPAALHRVPRPDLAERLRRAPQGDGGPRPGFLAHLAEAGLPPGAAQLALELRLASGRRVTLTAPPADLAPQAARDLVLVAVPPELADDALLAGCIAPVVARLQRSAMAPGAAPERIAFGAAARRHAVARLVIPLWRNLSFLRAQLAGFARDAAFGGATAPELVYVLDSPEQRAEATALLRGLSALHDLPLALLVQDRNRGYAAACNAGAAGAAAPLLVFLNSDVVAESPGWLAALRRRLARDARLAVVGPKLLYPDGAIQHAGLVFARDARGGWASNHAFKGWPRRHPPACRARRVPAVTGAALAVRRAAFEAAGGFCTDYVLGDFEDSDLCLRLRAAGHEIAYEPAAELVHHERQSIAAHPGHAGTLAAAHNRLLHEARWGAAIAALMRCPSV